VALWKKFAFNQNKPINKQPANLQKKKHNSTIHKEQAQIRGKTARLATLQPTQQHVT